MHLQGDIILVQFPFTNLSDVKLRPALVISCRDVNSIKDLVSVQITSKSFDKLFLAIENSDVSEPLKLQSGIRLHKIFTVNEHAITRKISSFLPTAREKVLNQIMEHVFKID